MKGWGRALRGTYKTTLAGDQADCQATTENVKTFTVSAGSRNLLELTTRLIHWQQPNETRHRQQYARTPAHCQRGWFIRNEISGILLFYKQVKKSLSGLAHLRTWAKIDENITLCKSKTSQLVIHVSLWVRPELIMSVQQRTQYGRG